MLHALRMTERLVVKYRVREIVYLLIADKKESDGVSETERVIVIQKEVISQSKRVQSEADLKQKSNSSNPTAQPMITK